MKISNLSTFYVSNKTENKTRSVNFCGAETTLPDNFISSKNKEIKKLKLILAEKLIKRYEKNKERIFTDKLYTILNSISTKEEIKFIEDLTKKKTDTETIENTALEFRNFINTYKRSMNEEELELFKEFIPAIDYRTKNDFSYKGSDIYRQIIKAKNPEDKKDILALLESKFRLFDVGFINSNYDTDEKIITEDNISKLLKYKKENPKISKIIIPIIKNHIENYNFNQIKNFFDLYKSCGESVLLLTLSKNKNLDFFEIEDLFEKLKENPQRTKAFSPRLKKDSSQFIKFLDKTLTNFPELTEHISFLSKIPDKFIEEKGSILKQLISCLKGEGLASAIEYPGTRTADEIIDYNQKINWKTLTQNAKTYEEKTEIIKTVCEALNTLTRLNSRKFKNEDKWALKNKFIIDIATHMIKQDCCFDSVLATIAKGYGGSFNKKSEPRGQIRKLLEDKTMITMYKPESYSEYAKKFYEYHKKTPKRISPFKNMALTQIKPFDKTTGVMEHPEDKFIFPALIYAKESYNKIIDELQKGKKFSPETEKEIAKIHFILTNALPFSRGTAGISNLLTRSLYQAFGISLPATKQNVSLDLEAFCNSLEDYQNNWKKYFDNY